MKKVDARGLSCPQPVLEAKKAIESGAQEIEILTDTVTSRENIKRFAFKSNFSFEYKEIEDGYSIMLRKN